MKRRAFGSARAPVIDPPAMLVCGPNERRKEKQQKQIPGDLEIHLGGIFFSAKWKCSMEQICDQTILLFKVLPLIQACATLSVGSACSRVCCA